MIREAKSLRTQLITKLTVPLFFVVMLDAVASYYVAMYFTDQAYDRWLLDSAKSLVQEVKVKDGAATFELPPVATEVFRWDDIDKTFYKVESIQLGFMAGDQSVPNPALDILRKDQPYFFDAEIGEQPVRIASVLIEPAYGAEQVLVSVAETVNKRRDMMSELILAVILPQVFLVVITGIHIWKGVNRGLSPLRDLAKMIAKRSAKDFESIPDTDVPLEVRALTHTINGLLRRLGSTLITQQRFIENAAHQLRTPLAGLKIQAERALTASDLDTMRPALFHIQNSADRVAHLSAQLLVLARSEVISNSLPEFQLLDLTRLVRESCMDWVPKALDENIELGFDAPSEPVEISGDEILLGELLGNLLDNAIHYGNAGGHISVHIKSSPDIVLVVEDDGPGIPLSEREKVFERFYRVPGSPGEGCGLGLAIVKEIANLHLAQVNICGRASNQSGTRIEIIFSA